DVLSECPTDPAQVAVVAARGEELCQRGLRQRRAAQRRRGLRLENALHVSLSRDPSDAVARRERLGERATVEGVTVLIERAERLGTLGTEINIAEDVVFDQRDAMSREQLRDGLLLLLGHRASQWIVETRRKEAGGDRLRRQRPLQRREIDTGL